MVIEFNGGTGFRGALFKVNSSTGAHILISDFGDPAQGPLGSDPGGVAIENSGNILVTNADLRETRGLVAALFSVNPSTGTRTVLSDFHNPAQGPLGSDPAGVAVEASGNILVTDQSSNLNSAKLFRVNHSTGVRTVLSDFDNPEQGPLGAGLTGVAIDASGNILVVTSQFRVTVGSGVGLFSVAPSGVRTLISDFRNAAQGPLGSVPTGVAMEASRNILVTDSNAGTGGRGALFKVNPSTGTRTLLSDFGNAAQGPLGDNPLGVAVEASGNILVADSLAALFSVNPSTGVRTALSDLFPTGVAIIPGLE